MTKVALRPRFCSDRWRVQLLASRMAIKVGEKLLEFNAIGIEMTEWL